MKEQGKDFDLSKEPVTSSTIEQIIGKGKRIFEIEAEALDKDRGAKFRNTLRIGYTANGKRVTFHRGSSLFFFEKQKGSDKFIPPGEDRYDMLVAVEELGDASEVKGEKIKLGYLYSVGRDFLEVHPFLLMHPLTQTKYLTALRPLLDKKGKEFLLEGFPSDYKKTFVYGDEYSVVMQRLLEAHLPAPSPFQVIKPNEQHVAKFLESLKSIQDAKAF